MKRKDKLIQDAIDRGSNGVKIAIRRAQLKVALPSDGYMGNPTMLIWLGKQYLHQSDDPKDTSPETNLLDIFVNKLDKHAHAISPKASPGLEQSPEN
jgi:hypothetical protein